MSNFEDNSRRILRSFENKVAFGTELDNTEASVIAQMFDIAANDIVNLDKYNCMSYVITSDGYRSEIPVNFNVFRDKPPVSEQDIEKIA